MNKSLRKIQFRHVQRFKDYIFKHLYFRVILCRFEERKCNLQKLFLEKKLKYTNLLGKRCNRWKGEDIIQYHKNTKCVNQLSLELIE